MNFLTEQTQKPINCVEVYGIDHSPWVQAVLLGLTEKDFDWRLTSVPPLETFFKWGVLMPVASLDAKSWKRESSNLLTDMGFEPVIESDLVAIRNAWRGVTYRPERPIEFLRSFAKAGDSSESFFKRSLHNFLRSFIGLYMLTLITMVRVSKRVSVPSDWGKQFLYWERCLTTSSGQFIDGITPGSRDFLLFGVIQCHCSIPVPPLHALREDSRLQRIRTWICSMQKRYPEYQHCYSAQYFGTGLSPPTSSSNFQQFLFGVGVVFMLAALPIIFPTMIFYILKTPR
jgi:hypothetical protein